jgi:hypothetical protein
MNMPLNTQTFVYGSSDLEVATDKLHPVGLEALVRRGISHLLGNEQSAKVGPESSWAKQFLKENGRLPTADEANAQKVAFQKAAIASLYDGSIGTRAGGPRVDPLTAEMTAIAKREIMETLNGLGIKKFPVGEAVVTLGNIAYTGDTLIERRFAKHGDRIRKEAEKILDAKAKKAKAAAAAVAMAAEKGIADAESVGL